MTAFKHYNGVEVKDRNYAKPSLPFFFTTYQYLQFPFILKFCRYTRTRDRSVECCILVTFTQDQKNILPRVKKKCHYLTYMMYNIGTLQPSVSSNYGFVYIPFPTVESVNKQALFGPSDAIPENLSKYLSKINYLGQHNQENLTTILPQVF